mgnify:CR=1 FL=1
MPRVRKYVKKSDKSSGKKTCNIKDCNNPAVRSLSRPQYEEYMRDAGLSLKSEKERKITPCDAHYKQIKKKKKKDDKIKKVRHQAGRHSKIGRR